MILRKLAILDVNNLFGDKLADKIRQALPGTEVIVAFSSDDLINKTNDVDALITWPFVDQKTVTFCQRAPSLKWIQAFTAGVDGIMKSELRNLDIKISAIEGIHGPPISDHVIAFIFSFLRSLPALGEYQRKKEWFRNRGLPLGEELASEEFFDKTVGIIGLGTVGTCIAQKCKRLGMRVLAIPLTPETDKMIGEKELRAMKKTAYLINIARGGVVDEKALIKALQDKEIAGAGLDAVDYSAINISWGVLCNLIPPFLVIRKLSAQVHIAN